MSCKVDTHHMQKTLLSLGASHYAPGYVAWCDGNRGVNTDGSLNVFGTNNTDCKLKGKQGQVFPYLKGDNYDEPLGVTTADRVIMGIENGKPITAQEVLEDLATRARKSGFDNVDVKVKPQHPVVMRFMNAFVPLTNDQEREYVVPTHYSYQTTSKAQPRNLLVSGHKGGIDVQADDRGENPLYSLSYKEDSTIDTHFYTVQPSQHAVGEAALTDRMDPAASELPAPSTYEIGIRGMGPRSNAFCVMSIPNKVKNQTRSVMCDDDPSHPCVYRSLCHGEARAATLGVDEECSMGHYSVGKDPVPIAYDGKEPVVITVLYYNTLKSTTRDGPESLVVPAKDIAMAVQDMDKAYNLCHGRGRLSELDPMLSAMTKEALDVVKAKVALDPPSPPSQFVFKSNAASIIASTHKFSQQK